MDGYVLENADGQFVRKRLLLELDLATTLRYVESSVPVHGEDWLLDDQRWIPYPFRPPTGLSSQAGDLSGVSSVQVPINQTLYDALEDGTLQDSTLRVYEAYFDPETSIQLAEETVVLAEGRVDEPTYDRDRLMCTFRFDSTLDLQTIFIPRRKFTRTCPFVFKGPGCQSTGAATSCDHSFSATGCQNANKIAVVVPPYLGNQLRYGGFLSAAVKEVIA